MGRLRNFRTGLGALSDRARVELEMDEELAGFFAESVREKMRCGMSLDEAKRAARVEMGSVHVVKHQVWNARWEAGMDRIWADVRLGVRGLMKSPGFTLVAVLSLGLGIGGNTAIFTLIHQVLMRELPVEKPEELAIFGNSRSGGVNGGIDIGVNDMATYDFARQLELNPGPFAGVAYYSSFAPQDAVRVAGADGKLGEAQQELVSVVSGNYFAVIGAQPLLGRTILPNDAAVKGEGAVAVVSWHYWQQEMGGDRSALGRTITLNGTSFRVIGVMQKGFYGIRQGMQAADLYIPMSMIVAALPGPDLLQPDFYFLHMFGRMRGAGDSKQDELKKDQAWLNGQVQAYIRAHSGGKIAPDREKEIARAGFKLLPGAQGVNALGSNFGASLEILMVVVGLVLLIACANLANFLLARAAARQRETATRLALGSTRGRIVRQSLVETLLLSMTGGALGLLIAFLATRALIAFVAKDAAYTTLDAKPDGLVLLFTLGVSLATGMLFGLGPAWSMGRMGAAAALGVATRTTTGSRAARFLPRVLVAVQVVLSLVLLVGAGLFLRSLNNLQKQDFGFERTHLLLAVFNPTQNGYTPEQAPALMRTVEERLSAMPGVTSAAMSLTPPISGGAWSESWKLEGYTPAPEENMSPIMNRVTGKYFETVGIAIVQGRAIGTEDTETSMKAAVINETAAKRYFSRGDAVGKTVTFDDDNLGGPWRIVGVARDTMVSGPRDSKTEIMGYVPLAQMKGGNRFVWTMEVKTAMDPKGAVTELRRAVASVDPNLAVTDVHTVQQEVDGFLMLEELIGALTGVFSALALVLAAIGLYGVMSYAVVRRTSEIGIRLALGAQTRMVLWMVLKEALVLLAVGLVVGLPLTFAVTRLIREQLFGLNAADPGTFAAAIAVVGAMTVVAAWLPARRASRVDPMVALRCE